ncbi:MAG: sigma-70 family RNA polymerase sigma factor [Rhodobacteraceae bacterium]|nr:sigma-70 family RNA polymerase sigma factor [Paracoccaceae bacterium]
MEKSSENLAAEAGAGSAEAFGVLLERHYDLMYRVAYRTLGQQADAEDLVQEICAALPKKLQSFRSDAKFESWLYRVVVNAGRDLMRKRGAQARAADGWGDVEVMQREAAVEKKESLSWLARAMQRLSPELRETVALVLGEEMTHAQAGKVLGLKEGSVSWRMNEVKKELRLMAQAEEMLE